MARDSRLTTFWRQASAILIAERGFSPACQAKLASLRERLRLTDQEYAEAIAELQSNARLDQVLTRYEQAFLEFLKREFSRLSTKVLTLVLENRAIAIAQSKYQIGATRARILLERQCESSGIRRVEASEAEDFIQQVITEELESATFLADAQTERIQKLAGSWGVEKQRVDVFIEQALQANWQWQLRIRRRKWYRQSIVGIALAFITAAVGWMIYTQTRWQPDQSQLAKTDTEKKSATEMPHSWLQKNETLVRLVEVNPRESVVELFETLTRSDEPRRTELYRDFWNLIRGGRTADSIVDSELFFNILNADPQRSQTGKWFSENLCGFTQGSDAVQTESLLNREAIEWWMIGTLLHVTDDLRKNATSDYPVPDFEMPDYAAPDFVAARQLVINRFGAELCDRVHSHGPRPLLAAWIRRKWLELTHRAPAEPGKVVLLVKPLKQLAVELSLQNELASDELRQFESRVIYQLLLADLSTWKLLTEDILDLVKDPQQEQVEYWIEFAERVEDRLGESDLLDAIGKLCLDQSIPRNRQSIRDDLNELKLKLRSERFRVLFDFNQQANDAELLAIREPPEDSDNHQLPETIGKTIWAANLSLVAVMLNQDQVDVAALPPDLMGSWPDLRARLSLQADTDLIRMPSAAQRRELKKSMDRLEGDASADASFRAAELTKLAEIASGIEMLEWEDANLLGRYYLRELPDIERIAAEKALPRFRGWSRFLAALSDSIPAGRLSPQDALSMMQLAKGEDVQYRDPAVWRDEFSVFFKQLAIDALDRALAGHVADERQAWFTLKEYLYVSYFARGSLMGRVPSWARERELSPLFLATFVFEDPTVARQRLPGQESYLNETFASEMARDVFAQQLFAERLLVRLEDFNGNQDETPSGAEDSELNMGSPTLGETLLAQEQRLLIRLRQMRREMFDQLMKTGRIPRSKVQ